MGMHRRIFTAVVAVGLWVALAGPMPAFAQRGLPDFTDLVEKAGPAVVNIRTLERAKPRGPGAPQGPGAMPPGLDENDPFYEFFRRFFPPGHPGAPGEGRGGQGQSPDAGPQGGGEPENQRPRGVGSGFVISADGFILSNHHVVEGADEVLVTLTDQREFKARVVGSDQRTDVALLKIEAAGLPTLPLGDPSKVKVGAWVLAIGSPFGLENTVTAGIVSAKGRETGDYLPFIQTDVAVNPGNSGGPLLNMDGEVIGINSQIYSRTGGFMGISFAIPIDEAKRVADQLRASGRVIRGRIGVAIGDVTREVAEALGLKGSNGALVRNVDPEGPAAKAGIEPGDIVLSFAGKPVQRMSDLPRLVGNTTPGRTEAIEVWRRGERKQLRIQVVELEPEARAQAAPAPSAQKPSVSWLGLGASELTEAQRARLRLSQGVLVSAVSGLAERAGIRQGDIILSVDRTPVASVAQFSSLVERLDRKRPVALLVHRDGASSWIVIKP